MAVVEGHTHALPLWQGHLAPTRLLSHQFQHPLHPGGADDIDATGTLALGEQGLPERHRIGVGRMGQFINEALNDKRDGIGAGCPEGSGGDAHGDQRQVILVIGDEPRRKLAASHFRTARGLGSIIGDRDEMVAPSDDLAVSVNTAREIVPAARPIEVMAEIVFAGPDQLNRCANFASDPRGLDHEIVDQASTKAAAAAGHMDRDVIRLQA